MVLLTFFVSDEKHTFWENLVQKIKIVSLCWNLVHRIIRISKIPWWCSLFSFSTGNNLFGQVWSKKLKLLVYTESWYLDQFEYAKFRDGVHFFYFQLEIPFLGKFGPKTQNCQFRLKFGTRLIQVCRIQWRCLLFPFSTGKTVFGKFEIKIVSIC